MFEYVHHVHYLVSDLDATVEFMKREFGMTPEQEHVTAVDAAHAEREEIREAHFRAGPTLIEVTQPLNPDSTYGRRLAEHGPHIMHIGWGSNNLDGIAARLTSDGVGFQTKESPRGYRTLTVDLDDAFGTYFQLVESESPLG